MIRLLLIALMSMALMQTAWAQNMPYSAPDAPQHERPSPQELEQAVECVKTFAAAVYRRDYPAAFAQVRGIDDPVKAGNEFTELIRNDIAALTFRQLSICQSNIEALSSAIESFARDHDGRYPPTLKTLVDARDLYLTELPKCPAQGTYEFKQDKKGYRVYCHVSAHSEIGVKGDFPAFVSGSGLTLGGQKLDLSIDPRFLVKSSQVTVEDFIPEYNILQVRLEEETSIYEVDDYRHRSSRFSMSRKDGHWLIDLYLSNRDMAFVYDYAKWRETAAIPKQMLFFYDLRQSPVMLASTLDRAQINLRVCEANLRAIGLAIEAWSVENHGKYPRNDGLKVIIPKFIARLPVCPAGGVYVYSHAPKTGRYLVRCHGDAHEAAGLPPNYPTMDPVNGITAPKKDQ